MGMSMKKVKYQMYSKRFSVILFGINFWGTDCKGANLSSTTLHSLLNMDNFTSNKKIESPVTVIWSGGARVLQIYLDGNLVYPLNLPDVNTSVLPPITIPLSIGSYEFKLWVPGAESPEKSILVNITDNFPALFTMYSDSFTSDKGYTVSCEKVNGEYDDNDILNPKCATYTLENFGMTVTTTPANVYKFAHGIVYKKIINIPVDDAIWVIDFGFEVGGNAPPLANYLNTGPEFNFTLNKNTPSQIPSTFTYGMQYLPKEGKLQFWDRAHWNPYITLHLEPYTKYIVALAIDHSRKYYQHIRISKETGPTILDEDLSASRMTVVGENKFHVDDATIALEIDSARGGIMRYYAFSIAASIPIGNLPIGNLESPQQESFESGIGLIRGWMCQADNIEVQIDGGQRYHVAYGTARSDTKEVCGHSNTGFGFVYNWNSLGNGNHNLRLFVDNQEFTSVNFTTTTLGTNYLHGVSYDQILQNFPENGHNTKIHWSGPHQNFVIVPLE